MKLLVGLCLINVAVMFGACEKNIVIAPLPYQSKVSIQSMLEVDSLPVVYFNRTVPYFDTKLSFGDLVIRNADVNITDGTAMYKLTLDSTYDKIYCQYNYYYKGKDVVLKDKSYTLNIVNGQDQYTAIANTFDQIKPVIDSTSYTPTFNDLFGEHEGVLVYFRNLTNTVKYFRYEMIRYVDTSTELASQKIVSPCLGRDSVKVDELGRSVYNDLGQTGSEIRIVVEPAYTHVAGTTGYIYIQTIDENAYEFFDQLDKQKLAQFNPFVEPVFLKDGQFGKKAIGYFSAMLKSDPVSYEYPE
jgi:hypothetical protein